VRDRTSAGLTPARLSREQCGFQLQLEGDHQPCRCRTSGGEALVYRRVR
jgi:hypothetical protein